MLSTIPLVRSASNQRLPQYDVPVLKDLAFNHIRGQLANCDIVEESFSRFAFQ